MIKTCTYIFLFLLLCSIFLQALQTRCLISSLSSTARVIINSCISRLNSVSLRAELPLRVMLQVLETVSLSFCWTQSVFSLECFLNLIHLVAQPSPACPPIILFLSVYHQYLWHPAIANFIDRSLFLFYSQALALTYNGIWWGWNNFFYRIIPNYHIGQGLLIKDLALPIFCNVKVVFNLFNYKSPKIKIPITYLLRFPLVVNNTTFQLYWKLAYSFMFFKIE